MILKLCVLPVNAKYQLYFGLENTIFLWDLCSMTFLLSIKSQIQHERAVENILTLCFLITMALPTPDGVSCCSSCCPSCCPSLLLPHSEPALRSHHQPPRDQCLLPQLGIRQPCTFRRKRGFLFLGNQKFYCK